VVAGHPVPGMARMRLWGELTEGGRDDLLLRWYNLLPAIQAERILGEYGMSEVDAEAAAKSRPLADRRDLPDVLAAQLSI
jgi:allantoicase